MGLFDHKARKAAKQSRRALIDARPGKVIRRVGEYDTFMDSVEKYALTYAQANLPQFERDRWTGETNKSDYGETVEVKVTLKHKCGLKLVCAVRQYKTTCGAQSAIRDAGGRLGLDIVRGMNDHKCHVDRDGGVAAPPPVTIKGEFKSFAARALETKEPEWVCPICGTTDDKYPEWEGECNHVNLHSDTPESGDSGAKEGADSSESTAKARSRTVAEASDEAED